MAQVEPQKTAGAKRGPEVFTFLGVLLFTEIAGALDGEITELESALKVAHQLSGTQNWISTGGHITSG